MNPAQAEENKRNSDVLTWAFGPEISALFEDPTVIEIMLNPDGNLWVERLGEEMQKIGTMPAVQAESLMSVIASLNKTVVTEKNPSIACELPPEFHGARFQGLMPPVVKNPTFTIRKKAIAVFTLADYVQRGIMTQPQREVIEEAVRNRRNILIAGGTGSGKTTLTNAVVQYIADTCNHRIVILEDTGELRCTAENSVAMLASPEFPMTRLLKDTLRLNVARILVGEVRDGAALDLLMAWNTGHEGGVCTLHADSAEKALTRMEQLIAMVSPGPMQKAIAEAVNLVVYIEKCSGSRRIKEIVKVNGFDGQKYLTEAIGV